VPVLGFVVALPGEARTLSQQRLDFEATHALPGGHWIGVSGAGPERAHRAARKLLDQNVDALISWGCAGALKEDLQPGHLVIPECILSANHEPLVPDRSWHQAFLDTIPTHLTHHTGTLLESRSVIKTADEKSRLQSATGALAIDMESAAIARLAKAENIPFLVIRSIADDALMNVPEAINQSLNPRGDVRMGALLLGLLRRPQDLPGLIQLGRSFALALTTLRAVRDAQNTHFSLKGR
jgi:adenosylhomocysteine nucleosidase